MLSSIRLKNYRAYRDTGEVPLTKLNVLLGANNAGKSSFASAIELFFRGYGKGGTSPLPMDEMPSMSSFDSILRKDWSPKAKKPRSFELEYKIQDKNDSATVVLSYMARPDDNIPQATSVKYNLNGKAVTLTLGESDASSAKYSISISGKKSKPEEIHFSGLTPYLFSGTDEFWSELSSTFYRKGPLREMRPLEVVNPSRPVPRSVYVLDEPTLGLEDKDMVTYLIGVFNSPKKEESEVRKRIVDNLETLGLAKDFEVVTISKKTSSRIVSIRVSPSNKRQKVTIADVGFGLSQVLPLVVKDARVSNGGLIAYQPEVHLHPYAQSRLADIFVSSALRGNQVFVETHSPDLILRLQKLIADGVIPAKDVSVFCFENAAGASSIERIDFDGAGSPNIKWPSGFLDTSLNLARDLALSRSSKGQGGR